MASRMTISFRRAGVFGSSGQVMRFFRDEAGKSVRAFPLGNKVEGRILSLLGFWKPFVIIDEEFWVVAEENECVFLSMQEDFPGIVRKREEIQISLREVEYPLRHNFADGVGKGIVAEDVLLFFVASAGGQGHLYGGEEDAIVTLTGI